MFLFLILGVYIYNKRYYVIVRFNELGPISKNMAVYYNGFKVGKVSKIEPDSDFKHTLVRLNLVPKNLKLPQNATVNVEKFPTGEIYLKLVYPQNPSLSLLKRGDMLEGISPYNPEQFMLGQNISGVTDVVSIHVIKALNATEIANMEMKKFFQETSQLIQDNRKSINASVDNTATMTKSLAQAAENLNQATNKLNNSLDESVLRDTTVNVKDSTANIKDASSSIKDAAQNIKDTTENLSRSTKDMDKTMKKVDDTVSQASSAAGNVNDITAGLKRTLSKRFAGMRILFGKPVK